MFATKTLILHDNAPIPIGRTVGPQTVPRSNNAFFSAPALSRVHGKFSLVKGQVVNIHLGVDSGFRLIKWHVY